MGEHPEEVADADAAAIVHIPWAGWFVTLIRQAVVVFVGCVAICYFSDVDYAVVVAIA